MKDIEKWFVMALLITIGVTFFLMIAGCAPRVVPQYSPHVIVIPKPVITHEYAPRHDFRKPYGHRPMPAQRVY